MSEALLSVRDLRTSFRTDQGALRAVDGVSFDVLRGETLGIVGESGCGKTVTALSILRLLPEPPATIEEGSSVRFLGEELLSLQPEEMRALRGNEISMIFQEPMSSLNPVYTVGSQITEALRLHLGSGRREARNEAIALLAKVGIPDPERRVDAYPHQLSGGMRQRVMIAMAISCKPKLLIADEPTTALDVTIQAQILRLLRELRETDDLSVLMITHDLGVVAEVCDRVVVMYAGQVVESGTVDEVFAAPAHPYTRGLLASLPSIERRGQRLAAIPGTVPSPREWPSGCRFAPRCGETEERCRSAQSLVQLGRATRVARCWKAGRGA